MSPDIKVFGNLPLSEDSAAKNGWITGLRRELNSPLSENQQLKVSMLVDRMLHDRSAAEADAPFKTTIHSFEVATYAVILAMSSDTQRKNLTENEILLISASAVLHDVGKSALPELHQYGRVYSQEEKIKHQEHTTLGAEMAERENLPDVVIKAIRYHQERYDGSGYMDGLAGDEIPMIARLISLADATQAALRPRPHNHNASGFAEGELNDIRHKFGVSELKFDPKFISAFDKLSAILTHEVNLLYLQHKTNIAVNDLYSRGFDPNTDGFVSEPVAIARSFII